MDNNDEDKLLLQGDKRELSDCNERLFLSRSKEDIIYPSCRNFMLSDSHPSSVRNTSMNITAQNQQIKISECNFSRQITAGHNTLDNVSVPSELSLINISNNSANNSTPMNPSVLPFQDHTTSMCEIMTTIPLPLQSALSAPVITKRGPGRPRKDGSGPIQRKKIFPGRPRMRTRKTTHRAIIPISSTSNQSIAVFESRGGYHLSESALHEDKGYDLCASSEAAQLFVGDIHRNHPLDIGEIDDPQTAYSVLRRTMHEESNQEQWPGKVCAFCNLGENSCLGQGELTRFEPSPGFNPFKKDIKSRRESSESDSGTPQIERSPKVLPLRRQKSSTKFGRERGKMHRRSSLYGLNDLFRIQPGPMDELEVVGFPEEPDPSAIFESTGHVFAHHCCAVWSEDVSQTEEYTLTNVDVAASHGLSQRCSNCRRYGATIRCRAIKCNRIYHYPCATSCGTFQDVRNLTLLCPQHISQAPIISDTEANCMMCDMPGNIAELLFCTSCGHHYHGSCLDPAIAVNAVVRAGWQCPDCKVCQTCRRQPEDDNKMLVCDTCDKGYHTFCLKPMMVTIPKNGWKCKNCRICGDCGARTPGSGPSSRWHMNYTVCDSCYQQRNKGVACPLCGKAYRQFSQRGEMAQCRVCRKFIHVDCDPRIDQFKDCGTMVPYICPVCSSPSSQTNMLMKDMDICARAKMREDNTISPHLESVLGGSKDSFGTVNEDSVSSIDMDLNISEKPMNYVGQPMAVINYQNDISQSYDPTVLTYHLPRHLPIGGKFPGKKRMGVGRPRGSGKFAGKRRAKIAEFHRKRGPKPKLKILNMPGTLSFPGTLLDTKDSKQDDEPTVDNKMILCSSSDDFVLSQDLCVMCGSYGRGDEGRVIACSQCGQCYHPYCVSVKVTAIILKKGWRCLDCTVCEGCGQPHDEGRLLLCDDCDISYHTYCLDPPLDEVPQGNWKCKWCVVCIQCGSKSSGYGSQWQNNYTMCGPCSSQMTCPVCQMNYQENDLVIQCIQCERWLHGKCDQMANDDDAEICSESGYYCILCRPKDELPPHLMRKIRDNAPSSPSPSLPSESQPISPLHKAKDQDFQIKVKSQAQFYIDGVFLSESGMHQIKSLILEQPKKQRMRRQRHPPLLSLASKHNIDIKTDEIEENIALETGNESETKMEIDDIIHEEILKPDIQDNCEKKKRQRKLHKLGIGGFVARPRGRSLSTKEQCSELGSAVTGFPPAEQILENQLNIDNIFSNMNDAICDFQFQEKPKRRRRVRRKNPLEDSYPSYLQEAFFGKDLLDTTKDIEFNFDATSEEENSYQFSPSFTNHGKHTNIAIASVQTQHNLSIQHASRVLYTPQSTLSESSKQVQTSNNKNISNTLNQEKKFDKVAIVPSNEESKDKIKACDSEEKNSPSKAVDDEDLKDLLPLPQDLAQDDELMVMLMNGDDLAKQDALDDITSVAINNDRSNEEGNEISNNKEDPLSENIDSVLLSPHFNLDSMVGDSGLPQMDGKDVEDIIKGVLSPSDQAEPNSNSNNSNSLTVSNNASQGSVQISQDVSPQHIQSSRSSSHLPHQPTPPTPASGHSIGSPFSLPPPSPFPSEYGSPQLSEPRSPWLETESETPAHSQKNILKWETDEPLGPNSTISPVLYANINHPNLKGEFPSWSDRSKQIAKIWRNLPSDKRQPYLQKARENRAASRMQKAQIDAGKLSREPRSQREVDQERSWKQFQAFRQHQFQKQQQILQEQRAQAILKAQQMALDHADGQTSENLPLSTSLSLSSTVSPNSVSSPRAIQTSPPISSSVLSGSLSDLCQQSQQTSSNMSRSPSDSGSPILTQCVLGNQQQSSPLITAQINVSPSQCSINSQSSSLQQISTVARRVSTPVSPLIQVSRVRPPIDPSRLPAGESYAQSNDSQLSGTGVDPFVPPPRPVFPNKQSIPQVRAVYPSSPINQQLSTPRSELSRPSTPTVIPEVFQTPPQTPHPQTSDPFNQHSPTTRNQNHSQDSYPQPPSTPHPVASPYSPSQSTCSSSVTPSPIDPYAQSPGTPTQRFSQDSPFSQHLQRSQSTPVSPTAEPYNQQPLTPHPVSGLLHTTDTYNKSPSAPRQITTPTKRLIVSRQISDSVSAQSESQTIVPVAVHSLENEQLLARQHLRDLLQRQQQLKKQEQGQIPLRHWPTEQRQDLCPVTTQSNAFPIGISISQSTSQDLTKAQLAENLQRSGTPNMLVRSSSNEDGFRHPYPPGMRARFPQSGSEIPFRHPSQVVEQRLIALRGGPQEARFRMLMLQQQQQQQQQQLQVRSQQWPAGQICMPGPRMSTGFSNAQSDQYEHILHQRNPQLQQASTQVGIETAVRFGQPAVGNAPSISNAIISMHGTAHIHNNNNNNVSPPNVVVTTSQGIISPSDVASYTTTTVPVAESISSITVKTTVSKTQNSSGTVNSTQITNTICHTSQTPSLLHQDSNNEKQSSPAASESVISSSSQSENAEKHPIDIHSDKVDATDKLSRRKPTAGDLVKEVEEQAAEQETVTGGEADDEELDDDELLGLGNDFNILEYADPELDKGLVGEGEKSNILDEHLDLDDKDDELDEEVEEMKARSGEGKKVNVEIKQEINAEEEKKKNESEEGKLGLQNELNNADFQTKFLEFSQQRELEKNEETFEEESIDSNISSKIEEGESKNVCKLISTSSSSSSVIASDDLTTCQSVVSFTNVTTTVASNVLTFSSSDQLQISQHGNGNIKPTIIAPSPPGTFGQPQVSLHREQENNSPNQTHFVEHLRISQPPPYPANVPPPPPYQAHNLRPQSIPVQQQVITSPRGIFPNQSLTRANLSSSQVLSSNGQEKSLLQEQPLLLEDLVEQEKREQRRQNQEGIISPHADALLSDIDFERLKADVLSGPPDDSLGGPGSLISSQGSQTVTTNQISSTPQCFPRPHLALTTNQQHSPSAWQTQDQSLINPCSPRTPGSLHPSPIRPSIMSPSIGTIGIHPASMLHGEPPVRANLSRSNTSPGLIGNAIAIARPPFSMSSIPPPPMPPSEPVTEQERQQQAKYEQWLLQQQNILNGHQKYLETEVGKLRKLKKALNAKQRQLRKNNQELADHDASELARISQEQSTLQKQLDQVRKQTRQHSMLLQEYRMKQQKRQQQIGVGSPGQVHPVMVGMQTSPLGASHSPHRAGSGTPQSPMMSPSPIGPSPSPRMPHSPSPLMQNSPATMSPSPLMQQQSPLGQSQILSQSVTQAEHVSRPHQVHISQDDNNPFSESFQQREQLEKLQGHLTNTHQNDSEIIQKDLNSDLVGQPFPSLPGNSQIHPQTSNLHAVSGSAVRPPPPYPHHLRPAPSLLPTNVNSTLKLESTNISSQNQNSSFVNSSNLHNVYRSAPPPNITPYRELICQEQSVRTGIVSINLSSTESSTSINSEINQQTPTTFSYVIRGTEIQPMQLKESNKQENEQLKIAEFSSLNNAQCFQSDKGEVNEEQKSSFQLESVSNETNENACNVQISNSENQSIKSDVIQSVFHQTDKCAKVGINTTNSSTLTNNQNVTLQLQNSTTIINTQNSWTVNTSGSEESALTSLKNCSNKSISDYQVKSEPENVSGDNDNTTESDSKSTVYKKEIENNIQTEKVCDKDKIFKQENTKIVDKEILDENSEKNKDNSNTTTHSQINIKTEDLNVEHKIENDKSLNSSISDIIKDEPSVSEGSTNTPEDMASSKNSLESATSRSLSLSHTLSQSLPSSVTNTLNFTLRQTGMPTVCLSHDENTQLASADKSEITPEIAAEAEDKSQSSFSADNCNGISQSDNLSSDSLQSAASCGNVKSIENFNKSSLTSNAVDFDDDDDDEEDDDNDEIKFTSSIPKDKTHETNKSVTSSPNSTTNTDNIIIKIEPKEIETPVHNVRSYEIKKEDTERPACQLIALQNEERLLQKNEDTSINGSLNIHNNKPKIEDEQTLLIEKDEKNNQQQQQHHNKDNNKESSSKYITYTKNSSNNDIKFEQKITEIHAVEKHQSIKSEEYERIMKDPVLTMEEKEIGQECVDNINQNVLLKQLLQNCPSAETQRKADHFEEFIAIENKNCCKDSLLHDDREKLDDSRMRKPSYLDIRRAQLEKEPTPPPEELKPKRKRAKKKKPEGKDGSPCKKRIRKGSISKNEEDFDTYMETMMAQLRSLPPIRILEPNIKPNFSVCPIFGSGDLNLKENQLRGSYGHSCLPSQGDFYSTYPFGSNPPTPPASLPPTPPPFRNYYSQEFSHRSRDRGRIDIPASLPTPPPYLDSQRIIRDSDSPDTIISSSSPECVFSDTFLKWPGLQLIDDGSSNDERKIASPVVPLVAPIPVRAVPYCEESVIPDYDDEKDKENVQITDKKSNILPFKVKMVGLGGHPAPLKDSGNVAVTLTLSSAAAEDIGGVLSALANLLKISPPSSYEIVERTATPPSQKLGLYKKSKDTDVNIQTLLNGKPRFCRHCDIVVLTSGIRKKASDLLLSSREDMFCVLKVCNKHKQKEEDEVIFCSTNCYMQFALTHRSTSSSEKEAATIVNHISDIKTKQQAKCDEKETISEKIIHTTCPNDSFTEKSENKISQSTILEKSVFSKELQMSYKSAFKQNNKSEREYEIPVTVPSREYSTDDEQHILPESASDEEQTSQNVDTRKLMSQDHHQEPPVKKWKGTKWKLWTYANIKSPKYRETSAEEMGQILDKLNICIRPEKMPNDTRRCVLCHEVGDGETNGPARILNMDVDKWIHLNCALWSAEVYETVNGALINVDAACKRALSIACCRCHKIGASLKCFKVRCSNTYHFPCAMRDKCVFFKDKTMLCPQHLSKMVNPENELESVAVYRRVYVNRDEHKQVASMIHQGDQHLIRIGSLIFLNIGQLLPHQMPAFHTSNCIYPVGYKVIRMYWSMRSLGKRCQYICSICDIEGRPQFRIQVREHDCDDILLNDITPKGVWQKVLEPIEKMRKQAETIKVFPNFISGEDLFGLTEPAILRILESLPGVETLSDYNFKYGRSPFLELPLAINPTGCARTEPKLRTHFKRPHTLHTSNTSRSSLQSSLGGVEVTSPYIKQFVHSKSSQYRKMKTEWRNNVYLARSHIQGLGLYAARDIEKHTMVIEYIGQLIRNEIAERNEAIYEAQNRGVYMFRLDENRVIDATLCGGLARYMNHSCNPNCVAEVVQIDRENKILIIANRRITRGEELTYDYKFEVEDDQHKIPCLCGAPNCRKWMN
ncbi:histone-lysine N-methyltransferase 2C-like isoform X4 [Centruroides vittatus]|uniref:histone-lysine N-methyltransferase 2C-like isoform X4 n=1 Tax=Centruroides vittatus TaxID=120091 RepID=UPI00350F0521